MSAVGGLPVLVLMLVCSKVVAVATIFPVPPSYGDIAINEKNQVFVSLAPDGVQSDEYVFHICGDEINSGNIDKVISRQLGYKETACSIARPPTSHPNSHVGVKCSKCTGSETHILRCCNVEAVFNDSEKYCSSLLTLSGSCKRWQSIYQYENKGNKAYPGEAFIFPPVSATALSKASPSMGLVAVKKEGDNCPDWRFIMKDTFSVDPSLVTTICRQMGYTNFNPGYIMTLSEFEYFYFYNYNFSIWEDEIKDPYLLTSEIKCKSSQACLACCDYKNNLENCKADGLPPLDKDKLLVIRCSFYKEENLPESGSRELCEFTNGQHSPCKNDITMESSKFIAAIAVPASVLFAICAILTVTTILLYLKCHCQNKCPVRRRAGYRPIDGNNQQDNQIQGGPNPRE